MLPILEKSRSEWLDLPGPRLRAVRFALSAAYAAAGEVERACAAAEEVLALAQGLGSRRAAGQVEMVYRTLGRCRQDPAVASLRERLKVLADSFWPEREAS